MPPTMCQGKKKYPTMSLIISKNLHSSQIMSKKNPLIYRHHAFTLCIATSGISDAAQGTWAM